MPQSLRQLRTSMEVQIDSQNAAAHEMQVKSRDALKRRDAAVAALKESLNATSMQADSAANESEGTKNIASQAVEKARAVVSQVQSVAQRDVLSAEAREKEAILRADKAEQEIDKLKKLLQESQEESERRLQALHKARPVIQHARDVEQELHQHEEAITDVEWERTMKEAHMALQDSSGSSEESESD